MIIYKRHSESCPVRDQVELDLHIEDDLFVKKGEGKCGCMLWVYGLVYGPVGREEIRESLKVRDWTKAQKFVAERLNRGRWREPVAAPPPQDGRITVADATSRYVTNAEAEGLNADTVKKYKRLFKRLAAFAKDRGIEHLEGLSLDELSAFRSTWKLGPRTKVKELERLKAFFNFAQEREWLTKNPATKMKAAKPDLRPTMPFTQAEMIKILSALDLYAKSAGLRNAQRLRAFVLLLRYSGLRIGDATQLEVGRVNGKKLFLYMQKTSEPVSCVLPDFVVRALDASPRTSERFYFWTGKSKLHSAIGKWQRRLQRLFELAKISKGHAHRFRDTYATELLVAGVPMDRVSVLLGHQSIKVTERHYAPWTRSRQEQIEADLARAWSQDPIVLENSAVQKLYTPKGYRPN